MQQQVDFLIIGSGIAGLSYALKVADKGSVYIVTKSNEDESNTKYAQGGIAAVWHDTDTIEKHIKDTLIAGGGLCDEETVRIVVTEGTQRVRELIELGASFDKTPAGYEAQVITISKFGALYHIGKQVFKTGTAAALQLKPQPATEQDVIDLLNGL